MLTIHEQFTHQMCDRLETTLMGLGLVRLLQDARRFEEARETLYSLEEGFQGDTDKPSRKRISPEKRGIRRGRHQSLELLSVG